MDDQQPTIMVIVASVRPGRIGRVIADWAIRALGQQDATIDVADLAELQLPFMDEPNHPRMREYQHEHTKAWSARVDAADGFVLVTPEYNHSFAPSLKNALDYLFEEWCEKPVGFVSYGGVSAGTRGVVELEPVLAMFRMQRTQANVELAFAAKQIDDGAFVARESQDEAMEALAAEIVRRGAARDAAR